MYFLKKMVIAAALVTTAATANAVEIIHYDNKPKTIELLSGDERTIQFGDHVAVGTTSSQDALFRVQSAQGALHILAYAPFEKQRIQVKRLGDGRIMLFDLTAKPQASDLTELEDISVFMPDENQVNTQGLPGGPGYDTRDNTVSAYDISPIELTRYAAHRFYAPQRLHKSHQGITSQPLGDLTEQTLRVFKGMTGANTDVSAVTSYRAGPYHLVALLVVNTADTSTPNSA